MAKINSTIFKTFNSNIDSATSKIGLFNKSFHTMQKDLKTGNGVFTSIFGGKSITSNDIKSIQAMNNAMKGGATYAQAWQTHMKGATVAAKQQVAQCIKNKGSLTELTQGMKSATVASKAAAVGMNLLATAGNMIAFMAISKGIELLVNAIDEYIHAAEIAREKSSELTDSWVEENSSIDDSISKYKELREKLQDTSLTASEVKDVKEELLVVQQDLIDKYGQEALGIDLVNGKYDEQIAKLKELSKQKAQDYVAENYSNIQEDEKYVNEKVNLNASLGFKGTQAIPDDYSDSGFDLGKYLERYDKLDAKVVNPDSQYSMSGTVNLVTSGTREEVYEQLSQLFNDLSNDFGESNEDVNKFKETLSDIIQDSFDTEQMEKSKDNIKKYAEAQILSQNGTRKLYEEATLAVDKYNEALVSGKDIDEAKANLDSVKESVTSATSDISGASYVFDDIYSGINSTAEKAHEITKAFENNTSVKEYAEQLKGLSSDDLLKIDFEDNVTQAGEEAFTALMEVIGLSEDEVQALINKLVELGYIQGLTLDNKASAFTFTEENTKAIDDYRSKISTLATALDDLEAGNDIDMSELYEAFPTLMETSGDLDVALEKLIYEELATLYEILGKNAPENLKQSLEKLADQASNASLKLSDAFKTLSVEETVDKLSEQLEPALKSLQSAYQNIFTEDGFTLDNVEITMFDDIKSSLDELNKMDGIDIDYSEYENFVKVLSDSSSTSEQVQNKFDSLATSIVNNTHCANVNAETFDLLVTSMENMGLTNAREVLTSIRIAQDEITASGYDLVNITIEEANQFINSANSSDMAREYLRKYLIQKQLASQPLNTSGDVLALENLCNALGATSEMLQAVTWLKSSMSAIEAGAPEEAFQGQVDAAKKQIADLVAGQYNYKFNFDGNAVPSNKNSKKDKKDKKDKFSQTFNWVETLLDKLSKKTEELKKKFEDAFSLKTAKKAFKDAIDQITKEIKQNEKAAEYYEKKANGVKLSSKYKKLVDSGALKIEDITDEALAKQVELYQDYKDKAEACRDTIDDLRDSYAELADTFYSKPLEVRDNNIEEVTTQLELLDSKIENATSAKERKSYAKQRESLYKKEYKSYQTAEETTAKYLKSAKSNINQKSDKALKGLTDKQKTTITNAVKNGVEITDAIIDMDSLTPEALKAIENYNSALRNNKQAASDAAQAEQDLAQNIRENKQVKIDSKQDEIDNLKAQYENLDENDWQGRNANLDEQIKKTKTLYKLMIDQETDVVRKEKLRAELNKEIADLTEQQVNNIRTYWQNVGNLEGSIADERNSKQDYLEASSKDTVASRVENYNTTAFQSRKEAVAKLEEAKTFDPNTADYHSAMSEYWSLMAQASEAEYNVWKESVLGVYDSVIDEVTKKGDDLEKAIELDEAKGIEKDEYDYIALINQASAEIAVNQNKIEQLQQKQQQIIAEGGSIESAAYKDLQAQIEKCEDAIYDNQKAQIEYNNALANLPLEKLEKELELLDAVGNRLSSENDLKEKQGKDLSIEDYQKEIDNQKATAIREQNQANEAYQNMLKAMSSADGVYGGKTAKEWEKDFNIYQANALDAQIATEDLKNEMRDDVFWRDFNRKIDSLQHKSDMLSGIGDLISDEMKFDSDGNLTDLGRTSIAIDVANLENSQAQIAEITSQIQELQSLKEQGYYPDEDEYNEKLSELQSNLIDATKSTMSYKDAIVEMAKSMAENELDALNEIIDKRKEALEAKKSYYDYDKNLRNQNKEIAALEAEIAAMQNVDDAYTKAELARKQAELDELKEARDDTIIEHNYEIQSNGLDELQEDLQTKYDEYIDGIGRNFESIEKIVGNAKGMFANSFNAISDNMYKLLQSYGIDPNTTGIAWTKITDTTQGFATGGIIRSNYTGQDDRILVRVNPDETILTKKFTDMLPSAVEAMKNMNIFQPAMPPLTLPPFNNNTGTSTTNIDTLIRIDGNVDKTVVGDLKELANDLAKKTNLLDKSFKYTTAAMTKDAKSAGHKRTYH